MADYIKRKSVYDALCKICNERGACEHTGQEACHKVFAQIPAADVRENVRGSFVGDYDGYADGNPVHDIWSCSNCGVVFEDWDEKPTYNFCPNCGADMRGENDG